MTIANGYRPRFSLGRVLAGMGGMLRREAWPLLALTVLAAGALYGLGVLFQALDLGGPRYGPDHDPFETLATKLVWSLVATAIDAMTLGACIGPRPGASGPGEAIMASLSRTPALFGLVLILDVPITLIFEGLTVWWNLTGSQPAIMVVALVMTGLGMVGLVVSAVFGQGEAAVVAEGRSTFSALGRSLALTRRRRALLFGVLLLAATLAALPWIFVPQLTALSGDLETTKLVMSLKPLLDAPIRTLMLAFDAALFLELRRLVDPNHDGATVRVFD